MSENAESDQLIRKLLRRKDKIEAQKWLQEDAGSSRRNIGEMTRSDSIALVHQLYKWGAKKVFAVDIGVNNQYESTDTLIIALPAEAEGREKIFEWSNELTKRMGYEAEEDRGQEYLLHWFD